MCVWVHMCVWTGSTKLNPFAGVAYLLNYAHWAGLSSSWMDPTSYGVDETRLQVTQVALDDSSALVLRFRMRNAPLTYCV